MHSAGRSSNGRTAAFEAVNLGSIPSLPAVCGKKINSYFAHSLTSRTAAFEAENLGPIPSPAANVFVLEFIDDHEK